jgi:hypothetical protein
LVQNFADGAASSGRLLLARLDLGHARGDAIEPYPELIGQRSDCIPEVIRK